MKAETHILFVRWVVTINHDGKGFSGDAEDEEGNIITFKGETLKEVLRDLQGGFECYYS